MTYGPESEGIEGGIEGGEDWDQVPFLPWLANMIEQIHRTYVLHFLHSIFR